MEWIGRRQGESRNRIVQRGNLMSVEKNCMSLSVVLLGIAFDCYRSMNSNI